LREATVVIIVGELKTPKKNVNKPSMVDEQISFPVPEATTVVAPALVDLHHATLTV
jgi:hypothetical protein